jgi:hypothetical protein
LLLQLESELLAQRALPRSDLASCRSRRVQPTRSGPPCSTNQADREAT